MEKDATGSPRAEEHRDKPNLASRLPYNRKSQAKFLCVSCGHAANADQNAALNIKFRAQATSKMASKLAGINP